MSQWIYSERAYAMKPTLAEILQKYKEIGESFSYDRITVKQRHQLHIDICNDFSLSYRLYQYEKEKKRKEAQREAQREAQKEAQKAPKQEHKPPHHHESSKYTDDHSVLWNDQLEDHILSKLLLNGEAWFDVVIKTPETEEAHIMHLLDNLHARLHHKWRVDLKCRISAPDLKSPIKSIRELYEYECELQLKRREIHPNLSLFLVGFYHEYASQYQGLLDWNIFRLINEYMDLTFEEMKAQPISLDHDDDDIDDHYDDDDDDDDEHFSVHSRVEHDAQDDEPYDEHEEIEISPDDPNVRLKLDHFIMKALGKLKSYEDESNSDTHSDTHSDTASKTSGSTNLEHENEQGHEHEHEKRMLAQRQKEKEKEEEEEEGQ